MRVESVELHRLDMPLVTPFETSFALQTGRDVLLVKLHSDLGVGWGECVAMGDPFY